MDSTAVCASHPGATSIGTCGRCGRFCCEPCAAERAPLLCRECLELVGDPFGLRAQPFGASSALRIGWKLMLATLAPVTLVVALFELPAFGFTSLIHGVSTARDGYSLLSLYDWLIGVLGQVAVFALLIAAVEGRRLSLRGALGEATRRWRRAAWANLRKNLWVWVAWFLLVLPGIWMSVLLCFTLAAVVRDDGDALQCSRELVKGRWWIVAWWFFWAAAIAYGPAVALVLVGGIGARPFHHQPPMAVMQVLQEGFTRVYAPVVMPALTIAAYYQLHFSTGRDLPPMAWKTLPSRVLEARPSLGGRGPGSAASPGRGE